LEGNFSSLEETAAFSEAVQKGRHPALTGGGIRDLPSLKQAREFWFEKWVRCSHSAGVYRPFPGL